MTGNLVDPLDTLATLVWPEHDWPAGERVSIRGEEQAVNMEEGETMTVIDELLGNAESYGTDGAGAGVVRFSFPSAATVSFLADARGRRGRRWALPV